MAYKKSSKRTVNESLADGGTSGTGFGATRDRMMKKVAKKVVKKAVKKAAKK